MWFIGVEVEQETSAPPPKKNPGSAPAKLIIAPLDLPHPSFHQRFLYVHLPQYQYRFRYRCDPVHFHFRLCVSRPF